MKCLKCGYENEHDAVFCEKCGARLLPETPNVLQEEQWYYAVRGQSTGPCTMDEIIELFKNQSIDVNTYVWKEGMSDWQEFGYSELSKICFGSNWFCRNNEELFGPISKAMLLDWYSDSRIDGNTYVWTGGNNAWHTLKEMGILPELSSAVSEDQWYYHIKDGNRGPYTRDEMVALYQSGRLHNHSMVWKSGDDDWEQLSKTELYDLVSHSKQTSFGNKTVWITIAVVVAVIVVGVGGYLFVQNQASQQQELKQAQQQAEDAQKAKEEAQEKAKKAQEEKETAQKAQEKAQAAKKKAQQAQEQAQAEAEQAQAEAEKAQQQAQQKSTNQSSSSDSSYVVDTNGSSLLIRDEPGTDGTVVGRMNDGDSVRIMDTEEVDGQIWGKIGTNKWVFMTDGSKTYVRESDDD